MTIDAIESETAKPRTTDPATLIREHQAGVWRYVRYLGANSTEADEIVQEAFLAVLRRPFELRSRRETSEPTGDTSKLLTFPLTDDGRSFGQASPDTKFAASVAMFGMLLRDSRYRGNATYDAAAEIAGEGLGEDAGGYRAEFTELIRRAKGLAGE